LIVNVSGYASVIIPVYLVVQYLKRSNYLQRHGMHSMTPVCLVLLPCEFAIKWHHRLRGSASPVL